MADNVMAVTGLRHAQPAPFWLVGRRPWYVLAITAGIVLAAALLGADLGGRLSGGGYYDPAAESSVARATLLHELSTGPPHIVLHAAASANVDEPSVAAEGRSLADGLRRAGDVAFVQSYWDSHDPWLRARDGRAALVLVGLRGSDREIGRATERLAGAVSGTRGSLTVAATGPAQLALDLERRSGQDLVVAELVATPLVGLLLFLIFGSVFAAVLPVLVGLMSIVVTLGLLRLLSAVTEVSIFALNVTTALGFALSISYSLFLVTRFRRELGAGRPAPEAVAVATRRTGHTIRYSALTIALCLAGLLLLPPYFFRSLGWAGIGVVLLAGCGAGVVLPAVLALAGSRLDRVAAPGRFAPTAARVERGEARWYRLARGVMARSALVITGSVLGLLALALPFTDIRFGHIDERWLPADVASRAVAERIARDFPDAGRDVHFVLVPDRPGGAPDVLQYAAELSALPGVSRVDSGGDRWLQVVGSARYDSDQAQDLVREIRALAAPSRVLVAGETAALVDQKDMLADHLGLVAIWVGVATFLLLFLFTGSVILPVKALLMNLLVTGATFGVMVLVFQEGHLLGLLGGDALGAIDPLLPMLMCCIGFGVQLDYEIFLLAGIREEFLATGDNARSVAAGLARNGRLITSAAVTLVVALGAMALSTLMPIKLLGVVLATGLIIDATLIRILLVPSFMKLLGEWNWWAPSPLRRARSWIHRRPSGRAPATPPVNATTIAGDTP